MPELQHGVNDLEKIAATVKTAFSCCFGSCSSTVLKVLTVLLGFILFFSVSFKFSLVFILTNCTNYLVKGGPTMPLSQDVI